MLVGNATEEAGRLPSEANDFIGRAAELCRVETLLRGSRLVTLVGPGGVGKTRVARRAMEQAAAGYRDGVVFVPLSALLDPELLPHTVARHLDLPEQSRGSQLDAVLTHLRDQSVLLVLDTCEHIIDACALFAEADHHRDARGHGARHQPRAAGRDRRELLRPPPARACPVTTPPPRGRPTPSSCSPCGRPPCCPGSRSTTRTGPT